MSRFRYGEGVKKRRLATYAVVFLLTITLLIAGLSAMWYRQNITAVDPNDSNEEIITVVDGMSDSALAAKLYEKGLIRSKTAYELYLQLSRKRGKSQVGGYRIAKNLSVAQIVDKITTGDVAIDLVTILPAQRLDQIRASLIEQGYSAEEVDSALDARQYASHPALADKPERATLEGYLYPETFHRTTTTPLKDIVEQSLALTDEQMTDERIAAFKSQGLSIHDAVTIASIVEKEVDNEADRPIVAQVFLSRYKIGMMLGSDVTAFYGAKIAGLEESVFADTPYNTRLYEGLPPGPISNISASSLDAVAHPASTDYLYFVAGDDGKTYFSKTNEEHEALTAQHCKLLCQ